MFVTIPSRASSIKPHRKFLKIRRFTYSNIYAVNVFLQRLERQRMSLETRGPKQNIVTEP